MSAMLPCVQRLDVRGLEPPEPLELVLDALDLLAHGDHLCMRIEREPFPLYRILSNNGYAYCTSALPGLEYEVTIWRSAVQAP
jgi:uncharacterized protein (DUF2249 family)